MPGENQTAGNLLQMIRLNKCLYFLIAGLLLLVMPCPADIFYVSPLGSNSNNGSSATPWQTITYALSRIEASADHVHDLYVARGFYKESIAFESYVNVYGGFIEGAWERQVTWYPTFIEKPDHSSFIIPDKMTLSGMNVYGGLICTGASPNIISCRILMSNSHGISCSSYSSPTILNCNIKQCLGAGINLYDNCSPTIENTVVSLNAQDGICIRSDSNPQCYHVTVGYNVRAGIRADETSGCTIRNSIIWGNEDDLIECEATHSCISEGSNHLSNNSEDPLFEGWVAFNVNQPIYVSPSGSDTGSGHYSDPMKHLRQAMAFYSFRLTTDSPQLKRGSDDKDLGAFPQPEGYLANFGNVGCITLFPGDFYESGVVVTVPVIVSGLGGYTCTVHTGPKQGFICKNAVEFSNLIFDGGLPTIHQLAGNLEIQNSTIMNSSGIGLWCEGGSITLQDAVVEKGGDTGMLLENASAVILGTKFSQNLNDGILCGEGSDFRIHASEFISNRSGVSCSGDGSFSLGESIFKHNRQSGISLKGETNVSVLISRIHDNSVGVHAMEEAKLEIQGCFIHDNDEDGIRIADHTMIRIVNDTICYNTVGVSSSTSNNPVIQNCILWQNSDSDLSGCSASYSNVSEGVSGEGNFNSDPLFLDAGARDLHILENSPCIDAGLCENIIFRDVDGMPKPTGTNVDVGADEYAGDWQFTFDKESQGWKQVSVPEYFTPPVFQFQPGHLSLSAGDDDTFGYWESPYGAFPVDQHSLYRVRFRIQGSLDDLSVSPGIRLRIASQDYQWVDGLYIYSMGEGVASPPKAGRDYDLYVNPLERATLHPREKMDLTLALDIANFNVHDATNAPLFLDNVRFDRIPVSSLPEFAIEKIYDFNTGKEGWVEGDAEMSLAKPDFEVKESCLIIAARNNWDCFGFWEILITDLELEPDLLYRIDFTVRTDAIPVKVPTIRFRIFSEDHAATFIRVINSNADSSVTLTGSNRIYQYYFAPLKEYTSGDLRGLRLAMDMANFNREDDPRARIYLDRVSIFSSPLPSFPGEQVVNSLVEK